ncbi:MAG TPA: hypothetical protein VH083_13055 [Myxococcales bacterium]|jgi:hypothetical protein|nr:hypothetical protein [Myxococcales bacterium]
MSKVIVLSEKGKLVGTWVPPRKAPAKNQPVATVTAGQGQKLHLLEVEDAESMHETGELTKLVKKQLKLK